MCVMIGVWCWGDESKQCYGCVLPVVRCVHHHSYYNILLYYYYYYYYYTVLTFLQFDKMAGAVL
jgi:hypothetical protein